MVLVTAVRSTDHDLTHPSRITVSLFYFEEAYDLVGNFEASDSSKY